MRASTAQAKTAHANVRDTAAAAGGNEKRTNALGLPSSCSSPKRLSWYVVLVHFSSFAGATGGSGWLNVPSAPQSHSSGAYAAASVAVLLHVGARARRMSATVWPAHAVLSLRHLAAGSSGATRHRSGSVVSAASAIATVKMAANLFDVHVVDPRISHLAGAEKWR